MSSPPLSSDPRSAAASPPHDRAHVERRLAGLLDPVLSARRTAGHAADTISALPPKQQAFVLHWVSVVTRTNVELAFQLAVAAAPGLAALDEVAAEAWIIHALDVYDRDGLHHATQVLQEPQAFSDAAARADAAVTFDDVARVLDLFVQGLRGRRLCVETAPIAYTDSERIYLPARIDDRESGEENFLLYKATAVLLWAQGRYGTFDVDLQAVCAGFDDPARALVLLNALETIRLETRIARVLPGLARDMARLRTASPPDARCAALLDPSATVEDTIAVLRAVYAEPPLFDFPYRTALEPAQVRSTTHARLARDKAALQADLARVLEAQNIGPGNSAPSFSIEAEDDEAADYTLKLDGVPLPTPPEFNRLLASIRQDLGEIPDDYLVPARAAAESEHADAAPADQTTDDARVRHAIYFYDEWDYERRHYRKDWCEVHEMAIEPGDAAFRDTIVRKYAPQIARLKRTFERFRAQALTLKRQPEGDGIDFDALVDATVDMRKGAELAPLIFTRRHRSERDLAVMFMVDMSGSTKGWINDAERESLVMLCEALESLGDRYAICGFSGVTRKRCEIFRVKDFDEPYGATVGRRIAGMQPQDYTRMGAAIRHLTMRLSQVEARTRLLVTLSDGKPDDYSDNYRGHYGIEDTRQALIEAHRAGIKPFCITIDREARDYLPHMYGNVNWTLVDDVSRLPLKVADIYRRLTT
jgi:nitric oxide reductase NorD protein